MAKASRRCGMSSAWPMNSTLSSSENVKCFSGLRTSSPAGATDRHDEKTAVAAAFELADGSTDQRGACPSTSNCSI